MAFQEGNRNYGVRLLAFLQAGEILEAKVQIAGDAVGVAAGVSPHHQIFAHRQERKRLPAFRHVHQALAHDGGGGCRGRRIDCDDLAGIEDAAMKALTIIFGVILLLAAAFVAVMEWSGRRAGQPGLLGRTTA